MRLFLPLFRALEEHKIDYVVVGGLAVVLHGHLRMTQDVDLVVALDGENLEKLVNAFAQLDLVPRAPVPLRALLDPEQRRTWVEEKGLVVFSLTHRTNPMFVVDVLLESPLTCEELLRDAVAMELGGVILKVCSLEHLLLMKAASGRAIDLADIEELERGQ